MFSINLIRWLLIVSHLYVIKSLQFIFSGNSALKNHFSAIPNQNGSVSSNANMQHVKDSNNLNANSINAISLEISMFSFIKNDEKVNICDMQRDLFLPHPHL